MYCNYFRFAIFILCSDDCCHQKAIITIVDKAGNTAQCKNNLNPNFVPPDPNTCLDNEPEKIKCKFTEIRQLCSPYLTLHDPCKCREGTWVFWAEFQKVGLINIYNIYTSNAGVNASIRRNHDMVQVA
ncbi:hypothetical protein CHS0354_022090 [Potamilus streckersoni]|uniref:Uncharacterized protein n=1 Tax=Potamilus streckersoni TaxID=2493646 RepID=A0AAE0ST10_9BIVA|nr:hypothetical protein CHS0354_022090 [Potamilus streckersoni]